MNTFQSTLSSPRNQRILFGIGLLALVAGIVVLVLKLAGGSSHTAIAPQKGFKPVLPKKTQQPLTNANGGKITTYAQLSPEIKDTINGFVQIGAINMNYGGSWKYLQPNSSITKGYTQKKWATAAAHPLIPLPGYTLDGIQYRLEQATKKQILVSMTILPSKPSFGRPVAFRIGLVPVGKGAHQRWLVNYWLPASSDVALPVGGPTGGG
jgi:hypothetical protein